MTNYFNFFLASYVAGKNLAVITPPGWGKTSQALLTAQTADVPYVLRALSPSSPPEMINGSLDLLALQKGQYRLNSDGTPSDPKVKIVILDELFRSSDIIFDLLLQLLEPLRAPDAQVFWALNNFAPTSARSEALRERFAIWVWLQPHLSGAEAGKLVGKLPTSGGQLPPWDEVLKIRQASQAALPSSLESEMRDLIQVLVDSGSKEGFAFSPRIVTNIWETLARVSLFDGSSGISKNAMKLLPYLYPASSYDDAAKFSKLVRTVISADEVAIDTILSIAKQKFNEVVRKTDKASLITELGKTFAELQGELEKFSQKSPAKTAEAKATLSSWFAEAVRGEPIS